jgi:acetate kinase
METILVVNAGSSSLKFQVVALAGEGEQRFWPQLSRDPDLF